MSNDEYEQQQFWKETKSEKLLKEINKPENIKALNEFYKNYRSKHSKYITNGK